MEMGEVKNHQGIFIIKLNTTLSCFVFLNLVLQIAIKAINNS
jgi:hypothetical protein